MTVTLRSTPRRERWFRDHDGIMTISKYEDSARPYTFDLANEEAFAGGATLSSVTWAESGPTLSSKSNTTTTHTVTVTGTGTAIATATLSDGVILVRKYRWNPIDTLSRDYVD